MESVTQLPDGWTLCKLVSVITAFPGCSIEDDIQIRHCLHRLIINASVYWLTDGCCCIWNTSDKSIEITEIKIAMPLLNVVVVFLIRNVANIGKLLSGSLAAERRHRPPFPSFGNQLESRHGTIFGPRRQITHFWAHFKGVLSYFCHITSRRFLGIIHKFARFFAIISEANCAAVLFITLESSVH
jgi:hypothetical protein